MPSHLIALGNEWDNNLNVIFRKWANKCAIIL